MEIDGFDSLDYDDGAALTKGVRFEYDSGAGTVWIQSRIIGSENTAYSEAMAALFEKGTRSRSLDIKPPADQQEIDIIGVIYDACVIGWGGIKSKGKDVEATKENFIAVMRSKKGERLFTAFRSDAGDRKNFQINDGAEAAKN